VIKIGATEGTIIFNKDFIKEKRSKKEKLLLVAAYLKLNSPLNGNVGISINVLAEKIGYKPDTHDGKINDKIKKSLTNLIDSKDIFIENRLSWSQNDKWKQSEIIVDDLKATDCAIIHINEDSKLFYPDGQYVVLTETEFITIVQSNFTTDREDILNTYLNIKKFMNFEKERKQLCYPSHTTLCKDCNISSTGAINNIIGDLISMGLLYTYNSGKYKDNKGNVRYANNFYALDGITLNAEVCDDIIRDYYSSSRGILINEFIRDEI
jgi:hypothetical protein